MASQLSFLAFPAPVRQKIYASLVAPHPDEHETAINYALNWNWLENPSNTTFGGIPQIDLCRCPRQKPRVMNIGMKDHIYTRYICYGPEVKFKSGREDLWVLSQAYGDSGQINFLRPARDDDLSRRPNANILSTCRTVYEEALPILYRGRNFLFVAGPCPRGRYQAYATQRFFAGLSTFARMHVTAFSLIIVPHEEDCRTEDVEREYSSLTEWLQRDLPSFETLRINLWHPGLANTLGIFGNSLRKDGVKIVLDRGQKDDWVEEIENVESFRAALLAESHEIAHGRATWKETQTDNRRREQRRTIFTSTAKSLLGKRRGKDRALVEYSSREDGNEAEERSHALLSSK